MVYAYIAMVMYVLFQVGLYLSSKIVSGSLAYAMYLLGIVISMFSSIGIYAHFQGISLTAVSAMQWKVLTCAVLFGVTCGAIATYAASRGAEIAPVETVLITNVGQMLGVQLILWLGNRYFPVVFIDPQPMPVSRILGIAIVILGLILIFYGEQLRSFFSSPIHQVLAFAR